MVLVYSSSLHMLFDCMKIYNLFIHFTNDRHLGGFQFGIITNAATMNILMRIPYMCIPVVYIPRNEITHNCI